MQDSKERFGARVDDYARHRPGYPPAWLTWLSERCELGPGRTVVDLGAGTGILTALLLESGATVVAVEPNGPMRARAERTLSGHAGFRSVAGAAEATGLPDRSADAATAGQAFHWFDVAATRAELLRVLRPPRWVALVWNMRVPTPFNDAYEDLLVRYAPDYPAVRARDRVKDEAVRALFAPAAPVVAHLPNAQRLDEPGLRGRLMSSSFVPRPGDPAHGPLFERMREIFAAHATGGSVELTYDTVTYLGALS
jgi:SAM-dependent methyltransferase